MTRRPPSHSALAQAAAAQAPLDLPHVADLRFQSDVEALHRLGPRAIHAMLIEIGTERSIGTLIARKVARYASIDPAALSYAGGDRFPRRQLIAITGGKEVE
jgi:hypothetical protein